MSADVVGETGPSVPPGRPSGRTGLLLVGALLALCLWAPVGAAGLPSPSATPWLDRRIVAVTHNGGEDEVPGDTLFALQHGVDLGMQVIDVDLQESKDHQPVLIHNDTLDSRTNGTGKVSDYTAEQLSQLDAAYWFSPGSGSHDLPASAYPYRGVRAGDKPLPTGAQSPDDFGIPTLRQVFERFPDQVVDIELKVQSESAAQVAALIHEFRREDRTIVASFDDAQIAEFQKLAPTVATSPGKDAVFDFFTGKPMPPGHAIIQVPYKYDLNGAEILVATPDFVCRAHQAGLAVWVWDEGGTPGAAFYRQIAALGIDGILGAKPTELLSVLKTSGELWNGNQRAPKPCTLSAGTTTTAPSVTPTETSVPQAPSAIPIAAAATFTG